MSGLLSCNSNVIIIITDRLTTVGHLIYLLCFHSYHYSVLKNFPHYAVPLLFFLLPYELNTDQSNLFEFFLGDKKNTLEIERNSNYQDAERK